MSVAVVTISIGDLYNRIAKLTHPSMQAYAIRIGAEFVVISQSTISQTTPHWEKFYLFSLLNKYDRVIYLDTDVIVRDDCPNLLELVPKEKLGMFNEAPFTDGRQISMYEACKEHDTKLPKWDGRYYNTGVMVLSKCHKYLFKKPSKEIFNFYEQGYLNLTIARNKVDVFELPYKFNRMMCMDPVTGEERFASYIIHYAGVPDISQLPGLIEKDIKKLEQAKPKYEFKRHVWIDVQGGLGDQVDAEPTIRYLLDHIYPNEDVRVTTHFPQLFQHLKCKTYQHGEIEFDKTDTEPFHVISLPGPETLMWSFVSNLLCHTVDFVSMAILRRTLPDVDKQIKLEVALTDVSNLIDIIGFKNLNDLVLVHPGRHWESKTFPTEWWQSVIDGLHEHGLPVCIIGKEDGIRGVLDVKVREGMIDLRDILDLGSFIALISLAKVLISNDSAPVHIAGAFDNHIILIPTCKHPDHILPWRNGSKNYKAVALYKKLTLDAISQAPTLVHGQSGEYVVGNFSEYLPEPIDVVTEAEKRFNLS